MQRPARSPDWHDAHEGPVSPAYPTARSAFEAGFENLPKWVDWALHARDIVVRRFGLTTVSNGALSMTTLPVLTERADVYEVGLEDRHLTFTLETRRLPEKISVTTRIWFNHWSGRVYLAAVLLPHKYILKHAIRSLA